MTTIIAERARLDQWLMEHRGKCGIEELADKPYFMYWLRGWYPDDNEYGWWMHGTGDDEASKLTAWTAIADMLDRQQEAPE
jgi:hypothetical protein